MLAEIFLLRLEAQLRAQERADVSEKFSIKTKGPGRSHADRGLKFGECKGVSLHSMTAT